MMHRARFVGRTWITAALFAVACPVLARAQTMSQSVSTLNVAAPTEAGYDAQSASAFTTAYTLTTTCTGSGNSGCRLFISTGASGATGPITLQFQFTGVSGSGACQSAIALNTPTDVTAPGASAIASSTKNDNCTFTIAFRVKSYNYVTYQSPGPYTQGVILTWTRP